MVEAVEPRWVIGVARAPCAIDVEGLEKSNCRRHRIDGNGFVARVVAFMVIDDLE
jgi:hypothetical protein